MHIKSDVNKTGDNYTNCLQLILFYPSFDRARGGVQPEQVGSLLQGSFRLVIDWYRQDKPKFDKSKLHLSIILKHVVVLHDHYLLVELHQITVINCFM